MSTSFLIFLLELIIIGLLLAFLYALMAVGLTLIYGILRTVNFAHGEFYMLGGYSLYYFTTIFNLPSFLGIPIAAGVGFLIAVAVERLVIRDIHVKAVARPVEYVLLGTFAVSVILQNLAITVFGPFLQTPKPFLSGVVSIISFTVPWDRLIAMTTSIITITILYLFIKKTWTGKIWMATSQNRFGAQALGVNIEKVSMLSFGTSGILAAVAGGLLAPVLTVFPTVGVTPLVIGFVIIVIGGLGSIEGSIIGGIIVSLVQAITSGLISPAYGEVAIWLLLILFLVFRPSGLRGEMVRTV
ncbi:MAG: branched-chain amino acid ABC transporter permease [Candidatus Caldarchaeum sp.]